MATVGFCRLRNSERCINYLKSNFQLKSTLSCGIHGCFYRTATVSSKRSISSCRWLKRGASHTHNTQTLSLPTAADFVRPAGVSFPSILLHDRLYSSGKSGLGLTDDILKSKGDEGDGADKVQTTQTVDSSEDTDKKSSDSDKKKKSKEDSWFSNKHAWKLGLVSLTATGLLMSGNMVMMWGVPLTDEDGNEIEDEFSSMPKWKGYPLRASKEAHFFKKMIEEPSYKKLLPDPLKDPWFQPPYTLVLELTDVLIHPEWTLGTGWRFKKRPAVSYFLQQIASPLFEVVVYTREQGFSAFPIVDGLDPNGHITFRLFRDATRYMNGTHVKDLDCLNRDLSKVIIVDCDPKAFQKHPRNALLLKKWDGNDEDRSLVDLAHFLRTIALSQVDDIRTVLEHYNQFDDPLETFKNNQRLLQEQSSRAETIPEKKGLTSFGQSFLKRR